MNQVIEDLSKIVVSEDNAVVNNDDFNFSLMVRSILNVKRRRILMRLMHSI